MTRTSLRVWGVAATAAVVVAFAPGVLAQHQGPCDDEVRSLRWLVQKYSADRAQLEFALATSEARRQAAEADVARLKSAPAGQQ